jgi:outer membrane protein OmpA-like peptidoglycan-associated protein
MLRRLALLALPALALAACQPQPSAPNYPMNVFFTADSASLDDAAKQVIADAARQAAARPNSFVKVRGFAAPDSGSGAYNRSLAETRARGVGDALVAAGVAANRIGIEPRGAVAFTEFPTESRRVEIVVTN